MPNLNLTNESILGIFEENLAERRAFKDKLKACVKEMKTLFGEDIVNEYKALRLAESHLNNILTYCTDTHHPLPDFIATSPYLNTPEALELIIYLSHIDNYDPEVCRNLICQLLAGIQHRAGEIDNIPDFFKHWEKYVVLTRHTALLKTLMNSSKPVPAAQPTFSFGAVK